MSQEIELLTEIRDLLHVMAEPALAIRDKKLRDALRQAAGNSEKKIAAILLMDGSRSQAAIVKNAKIDGGYLSRLIKTLASESLIVGDLKSPKLNLSIPNGFFDTK